MSIRVAIVSEDGTRTDKLLDAILTYVVANRLAGIICIENLNLDACDNMIAVLPTRDGVKATVANSPDVVLSRWSGSATFRENAELQDVAMVLCRCCGEGTAVINGLSAIQLETCKPLQFLVACTPGGHPRVDLPRTVYVRRLDEESLKHVADILAPTPQVVLKPQSGGGSRGVFIIDRGMLKTGSATIVERCGDKSHSWIVQDCKGRDEDAQVRVEIIGGQLCYVVLIERVAGEASPKSHDPMREADNLCLCEIGPGVKLTLCACVEELAAALRLRSPQALDVEALARDIVEFSVNLSSVNRIDVLALEFRLDMAAQRAYMIDWNLQSNYSYVTEDARCRADPRFVRAACRYVDMFLQRSLELKGQELLRACAIALPPPALLTRQLLDARLWSVGRQVLFSMKTPPVQTARAGWLYTSSMGQVTYNPITRRVDSVRLY